MTESGGTGPGSISMRSGVVLLLVGLGLLAAAPAEAAKRKPCAAAGSKTVRADTHGRAFRVRRQGTRKYYACLYRSWRRVRIAPDPGDYVTNLGLASPFVVFLSEQPTSQIASHELKRVDIRSGATVTVAWFGHHYEGINALEDLVPTRRGTVAWIRNHWLGGEQPRRSVGKFEAGSQSTVDPGPDVGTGSLAVTRSGDRLYWTNAGEARSAPLR